MLWTVPMWCINRTTSITSKTKVRDAVPPIKQSKLAETRLEPSPPSASIKPRPPKNDASRKHPRCLAIFCLFGIYDCESIHEVLSKYFRCNGLVSKPNWALAFYCVWHTSPPQSLPLVKFLVSLPAFGTEWKALCEDVQAASQAMTQHVMYLKVIVLV